MRLAAAIAMVASALTLTPAAAVAADIPDNSTLSTIDAGSYIIDMGVEPQTYENGLLPYGLIYELMIVHQVPVEWIIDDAKAKDGVDFTFDGKDYKGGAFIVLPEYAEAAAPIIASWEAKGAVVDGPTSAALQAPVFDTLTNWPNAILDAKNGGIAQGYYEAAEIPQVITTAAGSTKTAYEFKDPSLLDSCDDIYVMPHADPEWETHQNLVDFNDEGGYIWAACHAVSVLENVADPTDGDPDPEMNFLSTNGLIDFGDHDGGTPPYSYRTDLGSDPIMQFIGIIDGATENGSEQIYVPSPGSAWRPSSTVLAWDPDHPDLASQGGTSPGEAAKLVYGRGFGDETNGYVMFEGGHSHDKGSADAVAAIRAFFNLHLMAGIERGIETEITVPEPIVGGATVDVSGTITGGTPDYTYAWTSSCGGSFATAAGTSTTGDIVTQFTAPADAQDCIIRLAVDDTCGRTSFAAGATEIVEIADLAIDKTDGVDTAESGTDLTYSLTVDNLGPGLATNVSVTDALPAELDFLTAVPSQGSCLFDGTDVICDLGEIGINGTATIAITGTIDPDAVGVITNTATVTASQLDPDPGNNSDSDDTQVGPNGLDIVKTADPDFIDEADLPAPVTFTMVVTNDGPNPVSNVVLTDDTCSPVSFDSGDTNNDGALDPGEVWQYTCTTDISNDTDNTATVTGDDLVLGLLGLSATDTAHVEAIAPDFTITKGPDGAEHSDGGDVAFEIVVTNSGDVDLFDLFITDANAPGCDRYIAEIAIGQVISYYCSISPAPAAPASGTNTISGTAVDAGGNPLTRSDDAPWSVVDRDLDITKTPIDCTTGTPLVDPAFYPGDNVCYEIVVTNSGSSNQSNVTLTDTLPAGLSLVDTVVEAPLALISDGFDNDLIDDEFYTSGLTDWNDNDKAKDGDVSVKDDGDCPAGAQCVEIKAEDVGLQWQTDLSGVSSVDASFDWRVTANDDFVGSFGLACWDGSAWSELQEFTIDDDTLLTPPGGVNNESFTGLALPATCQIASGAIGLVMDPASDKQEIFVDDVDFTLVGGTGASLFDNFEFWDSTEWIANRLDPATSTQTWLEVGDNDDKTGGDVFAVTPATHTDCTTAGDCAVGIEKEDVGIAWPTDYSTLSQCTLTLDWRVFETDADGDESITFGGVDAAGDWVAIDTIPITAATAFAPYSFTFNSTDHAALFHSTGAIGVASGPDNEDKELLQVDTMAVTCLNTFTTTANPDVVTAADAVTLTPGDAITATVTATVDAPGETFPRELANLAQTTSDEQPEPSEAVATVDRVVPLIELQKDADPLLVAEGDSVTYTFTVENPGNEPLENVGVTDTGIAGCVPTLISGDDNNDLILDLTETWVYECSAVPPSGAPTFVNTATAAGDPVTPGTGDAVAVSDTDDATVEVVFSGIEVVKSADRTVVRADEPVTYTYEVALAAGTMEDLTGVYVTDDVCAPVVGPNSGDDADGVLEANETWVYTCDDTLATTTTNTATAGGTDRAGIDVTGTDTETVAVIDPSFDVVKTANPTTVNVGDTVDYTIEVANTGDDALTAVAVSDDNCSPLSTPTESGTVNGILDVGETWTYTCSTTLTEDTTNVADVTAVDSLGKTWSDFDDAIVNVNTPSLALSKLNDGALIFPDGLVTYTIILLNDGDSDFDSVTVTDDSCAPLTGPTGDTGVTGTLEVGESWFYECMTNLATTTVNTVTVDADGPGGPVLIDDSSEVRVRDPQLEITKTPSAAIVDPGTLVTYDFTVTNSSVCAAGDAICEVDHELQNVVVTDDHCATVDPVDAGGDGFNDGDTGDNGPDGIMSIGEVWLFTCSATVDAPTTNTASATAEDVLGVTVPLTLPETTAFVDVATDPELTVVKTGPDSGRVGEVMTYTIDVTNSTDCSTHGDPTWCADNSWVENVTVNDDVAGAASPVEAAGFNVGDTDTDGLLDVGETWQFTVGYTLTEADLVATPLVNEATATSTDRGGDTETASATHSLDVLPRESDLSLVKTVSATAPLPGDVVTFTVTITNDGPSDATGVGVQDVVPTGFVVDELSISDGGVLTGSTIAWAELDVTVLAPLALTFDATVQDPTGAADEFENVAQVTASDSSDPDSTPNNDDGDQSEDDEDAVAIVVPESDLALAKAISNPTPNVGEVVTFTVTVSNLGPDDATNVAVEDVVPAGYGDVTNIATPGTLDVDTILWSGLTVTAFDFVTLTFEATVLAPTGTADEYKNVAQVTASDQWDPTSTPGNDDGSQSEDDEDSAVAVPQVSDLSLAKVSSNDTPRIGEQVTFTLTVENFGTDTATNVDVQDVLPAGFDYVAGSMAGGSFQDALLDPTLTWQIAEVTVDNPVELSYEAIVVAVPDGAGGLDPVAYLNAAEIKASDQYDPDSDPASSFADDDLADNVADDDEAQLQLAPTVSDLSITKTSTATPQVGESLLVELTVQNLGPDDATNVAVVDLLPLGLTYQALTMAGGTTQNDTDPSALMWTIDAVTTGVPVTLTYEVLVEAPTGSTDEYLNQAEITLADQWDPDSDPASSFDADDLGDGVDDDDEAEFVVDPQVADIEIDKIEPATSPNVGDFVTYQIEVTNDGPDDATNVDITDTLPPGLTYQDGTISGGDAVTILVPNLTWTINTLPAGTTEILEYEVKVEAPSGAVGEYTNVAQVTAGDQFDPDSTPGNDDATEDDYESTTIAPQVSDLSLTKAIDPVGANVGDTLAFTLTLTNLGPDSATGVVVEDEIPIGYTYAGDVAFDAGASGAIITTDDGDQPTLRWTVDGLEADQSIELTYTATIDEPTGAPGEYTNVAQVTAGDQFDPDSTPNNDDGTQSEDDEASVTFVPLAADLELSKRLSDGLPNIGDVITFTLELFNAGPDEATNVEMADVVPSGYTNVAAISGGGVLAVDTITWTIPTVASGETITVTYEAEVVAVEDGLGGLDAAAYENVAQVTASDTFDPDSQPGNDDGDQSQDDETAAAATPQVADLELIKTQPDGPINIGDTVEYTLTLTNVGPAAATNVSVDDVLPAGLAYVASSSMGGSGQSIAGDTLTWTIDVLPAGDSIDLTYEVTVEAIPDGLGGLDATAYANVAQVTASDQWDPDSTPNNDDGTQSEDDEATSTIVPEVSDLSITKASTAEPQIGELITVTLTVSNDGPSAATGIEVTDLLPAALVYETATMAGGSGQNDADPTALVWTVDSILSGDSVILTYQVEVQAPTGSTDEYLNQAEITAATQWDPDSDVDAGFDADDLDDGIADDDEAEFLVDPQIADVWIDKIPPAAIPNAGDIVLYSIIVSNVGPDAATNVDVTDTLPAGLTYQAGSAVGGDSVAIALPNITWTIDTLTAGDFVVLEYEVMVEAPTGTDGEYTNVAEVTASDQFDPDSTPANGDAVEDDYDSETIAPQEADLSLVKSTDDTTPEIGDVVTFSIEVENDGPDDATNVAVTDALPAGFDYLPGSMTGGTGQDEAGDPTLVWTIDTLASGDSVVLTYNVEIVAVVLGDDVDPAAYVNQAQITASDQFDPDSDPATGPDVDENGDGNPVDDDESIVALDPNVADVSVVKTAPVTTPNIGDVVELTITVTNDGPDAAEGVEITDVLPDGMEYQAGSIMGGATADDGAAPTLVWTLDPIAPNTSVTLTYDVELVAVADGLVGLDAAAYINAAEATDAITFDPDSDPATSFDVDENGDGDPVDDDESAFTFAPPISDLSVVKGVDDGTPNIGETVTFTLTVTNDGPDAATSVDITDVLPDGLDYVAGSMAGGDDQDETNNAALVWTIDTLAAGESLDLSYAAIVVPVLDGAGDLDPAAYANEAQVSASDQWDPDSDPATGTDVDEDGDGDPLDDDEFIFQVDPEAADVSLDKTSEAAPNIGDVITFTITVENDGPDDAVGLEITDVLPSGYVYQAATITGGTTQDDLGDPALVWTIDLLASGDSVDLTYDVEVIAVPDGAGGLDANVYLNAAEVTSSGTWDPDSDPATSFDIDDYDDGVDDDDESAFAVAPQVADLSVAKAPDDAQPNVGDVVTFTLTVTNGGPDDATNVAVQDVLPAGLAYQAASIGGGTTPDDAAAPVLSWAIDTIASGDSVDLTYDVLVLAVTDAAGDLDPAAYANEAQATASDQWDPDSDPATGTDVDEDGDGDPLDDDEFIFQLEPLQADLSLTKSLDDTTPEIGEVVTFTVTVSNDGPDDASNVAVEDVLPAGLVYQAATIAGGTTQDDALDPVLSWTIASLASGDSAELFYDAEVVAVPDGAGDVDPTAYLNEAQITGSDQFDPDSDPLSGLADDDLGDGVDDDDEFQLQVDPNVADLSAVKTAPVDRPNVGDVVTLTITVTNDGPDEATAVEITDVLPDGMAYQAGSIDGGDTQDDGAAPALAWTIGTLASGGSVELTYDVEIAAVPNGLGGLDLAAYINAAEITGSATWDPDSDPASGFAVDDLADGIEDDDETTFAFNPPVADLSIAKGVSDDTPEIGDVVTFTITVTNDGPEASTAMEITDVLGGGFVYQAGSMTGGSVQDESADPTLVWQIADIAPGDFAELTYDVEIVAVPDGAGDVDPGAYVNAAEISSANRWDPDSDPETGFNVDDLDDGIEDDDEVVVQVDPDVADLSLDKTASNPAPALGEIVTFTVTVTNDGPDPASAVEVMDVLGTGLVYQAATIAGGDTQDDSGDPTLRWTVASLASGDSVDLTYDVIATAVSGGAGGLDPAAFVNAAEITDSATWDPDSDPQGSFDIDDRADGVDDDDEAIVTVSPAVLGVAKSVAAVINNGDGTYDVSYLLTIENMGLVDLSDLVLTDDIVTQFTEISPSGFTAADGTLLANGAWDGTAASNVLATGQILAMGEIGTVMLGVTVTPGADVGPHENAATAEGLSPTGTTVTDDSTTGTDPDADGDDTDGTADNDGVPDENVPTEVLFTEAPSIGAAKAASGEPVSQGDGSFAIAFDVLVENTGDVVLSGVQVVDDLSVVFPAPVEFEVREISSADLTVNAVYDGGTDTALLAGTDSLAVGASGVVTIDVVVTTMGETGPFDNQATASGTSAAGVDVADLSQDGADVDPGADGDPTNDNEPTPFGFPELGALTGIVWFDLQADGESLGEGELSGVSVVVVMPGRDGALGTSDDVERVDVTESPYFFDNLPAGEVEVYTDVTTLPEFLTQTYDLDELLDDRTRVIIVPGQVTRAVDFGYIEEVELAVDKTGPPTGGIGSTVVWSITVDNTGTVPARPGVVVTDVLPDGVSLAAVDAAGATCTVGAAEAVCVLDVDLQPGDSFVMLVSTVILEGTQIVNGVRIAAGPEQVLSGSVLPETTATIQVQQAEGLPRTGQYLEQIAMAGLAMLLLGAALVLFRRRRTRVRG